ncbi:hypothetical protein BC477_01830 [Clavibacter michiganensis subsp. michiganensis]|uniref:Uncharacterized protein n=1 Tax=Clavibacter michiganensis subsp. michiganensis TaxID=33013 RepID=A0A251XK85_CLAMM|nr:hypothetical protein BC477_01830 [Clavibacter michiganensis subsp. michiganensis]OUE03448.1 hypothetical protein CMMCAS07_00765 [Clavibacter michiganensis subsp. michiganensis]
MAPELKNTWSSPVVTVPSSFVVTSSVVFTFVVFAAQLRSMSAASTGVPSLHLTPSLIVNFTTSGSSETFSYVPKSVSFCSEGPSS